MEERTGERTTWTFLTNHARVLAAVAENPQIRIRDLAAHCRLTERAVQKIISDLEQGGYLSHTRAGRSNTYRVEPDRFLRHPAEARLSVDSLLSLLAYDDARRAAQHGNDRDDDDNTGSPRER